jgi:hypothetical protein
MEYYSSSSEEEEEEADIVQLMGCFYNKHLGWCVFISKWNNGDISETPAFMFGEGGDNGAVLPLALICPSHALTPNTRIHTPPSKPSKRRRCASPCT